jgi:hypothetical protein
MISFARVNQSYPGLWLNIMKSVFMFGLPGPKESCPVAAFEEGNRNLKLTPVILIPGWFLCAVPIGGFAVLFTELLNPLNSQDGQFVRPIMNP